MRRQCVADAPETGALVHSDTAVAAEPLANDERLPFAGSRLSAGKHDFKEASV